MSDTIVKNVEIKVEADNAIDILKQIRDALQQTQEKAENVKKSTDDIGKVNFGNVTGKVKGLFDDFLAGEKTLGDVAKGVLGVGKALWTAFIANPIGPIILAISAVLGGLFLIFKKLDPVIEKFEQGFAAVGAVLKWVTQSLQALIMGNVALGKSMGDAAKEAIKLKEAEQELEHQAEVLNIKNKEVANSIDALVIKSKNRTLTDKERIDILDEAMKLEKDMFDENMSHAKAEQKIAEDKMFNASRLTGAQIEYFKTLKTETEKSAQLQKWMDEGLAKDEIDIWTEKTEAILKLENDSIKFQEKRQREKDVREDKIKEGNDRLIVAMKKDEETAAKAAEKANTDAEKAADSKQKRTEKLIEIKRKELELQERINDAEYNSFKNGLEFNTSRIKNSEERYKKEKDNLIIFEAMETKMLQDKLKSQEKFDADEKKRLQDELASIKDKNSERAKDLKVELKQYDTKSEKYRELQQKLNLIKKEYSIKGIALDDAEAQRIIDNNDRITTLVANNILNDEQSTFEAKKEALSRLMELELSMVIKGGEDEKAIRQKYADELIQIKQDEISKKADLQRDAVNFIQNLDTAATQSAIALQNLKFKQGKISQEEYDKNIANIEEKAAKRAKAYAIMMAVINTAEGITKALTLLPPANFIMAAIVAAAGLAQVATILATKPNSAAVASSGMGSTPSTTDTASGTSPNTSFSFEEKAKTAEVQPIKTYVLSKDVSNQQQLDRQLASNGSI